MNDLFNNSEDNINNLDKNILVDTLKHTSDIMTALSNKVYIMEEEIKNINNQLITLSNENKLFKESFNNDNFDKLYKTNQNINITYHDEKNQNNELKHDDTIIKKNIEIKKEEIPENIISNRKKNNLFIRKI